MTTSGLVRWLLSWYRSECENDREPLTIGDSPEEEEMMELLAGGDLS